MISSLDTYAIANCHDSDSMIAIYVARWYSIHEHRTRSNSMIAVFYDKGLQTAVCPWRWSSKKCHLSWCWFHTCRCHNNALVSLSIRKCVPLAPSVIRIVHWIPTVHFCYTVLKSLAIFPSPAGMSLTKLWSSFFFNVREPLLSWWQFVILICPHRGTMVNFLWNGLLKSLLTMMAVNDGHHSRCWPHGSIFHSGFPMIAIFQYIEHIIAACRDNISWSPSVILMVSWLPSS